MTCSLPRGNNSTVRGGFLRSDTIVGGERSWIAGTGHRWMSYQSDCIEDQPVTVGARIYHNRMSQWWSGTKKVSARRTMIRSEPKKEALEYKRLHYSKIKINFETHYSDWFPHVVQSSTQPNANHDAIDGGIISALKQTIRDESDQIDTS